MPTGVIYEKVYGGYCARVFDRDHDGGGVCIPARGSSPTLPVGQPACGGTDSDPGVCDD